MAPKTWYCKFPSTKTDRDDQEEQNEGHLSNSNSYKVVNPGLKEKTCHFSGKQIFNKFTLPKCKKYDKTEQQSNIRANNTGSPSKRDRNSNKLKVEKKGETIRGGHQSVSPTRRTMPATNQTRFQSSSPAKQHRKHFKVCRT